MMKKEITILQENSSPLVIVDIDERDIREYSCELSKLLETNNISILQMTTCSVIIRPHKINSMIVRTLEDTIKSSEETEQPTVENEEDINSEDSLNGIVTD